MAIRTKIHIGSILLSVSFTAVVCLYSLVTTLGNQIKLASKMSLCLSNTKQPVYMQGNLGPVSWNVGCVEKLVATGD